MRAVVVSVLVVLIGCSSAVAVEESEPATDMSAATATDPQEEPTEPASDESEATEPDEAESEPINLHNTIKWATASEVDNFGYNVYRGESEEGPFERVNEEIIAGAGTTDETTYYEFVDTSNDPTRAYYYYVESISMSGVRERFTPIAKVKAKQPADGETAEEESTEPSE